MPRSKEQVAAANRRRREKYPNENRERSAANRAKDGGRANRRANWKRHGMDPDAAEAIYDPNGSCSICGTTDGHMVVDHCHSSGQIRGLLCHRCNVALGLLDDDTNRLAIAISYLEQFK